MTSGSPVPSSQRAQIYFVDFHDPAGAVSWWDCFFFDLDEAGRWAEWELERVARGREGWVANIHRGHCEDELKLDQEDVETVGPSTGEWPPTYADEDD